MNVKSLLLGTLFGLVLAIGCTSQPADEGPQEQPADAAAAATADPAGAAGTAADGETDGLAELSAADRALAEQQKVCLVSGEPLGSMGTPIKTEVKGRTVFLCCEGCQEMIQENPDKYLARLDGGGEPAHTP